jgi:hypothetical protein
LLLGEVQQRDDRRSPPVGGEFRQDYLHLLVVFGAEIERRGVVVVGSLSVREIPAGEGEDCPLQQRPAQLLHHNYYTPQHSPSLLSPSDTLSIITIRKATKKMILVMGGEVADGNVCL